MNTGVSTNSPKLTQPVRRRSILLTALLALGTILVLLYIGLSPMVARPIYEGKLFRHCMQQSSSYGGIGLRGITGEDCWIPLKDGRLLHGLLFAKPGAKVTTLIHHGSDGNILFFTSAAEFALSADSSAFLYDYEGYGRSAGRADLNNLCADGAAAYDYLTTKRHIPASQIVHMGISLGTGVACEVAKKRRSAGVILISPYSSFLSLAKLRLPVLNAYPSFCFPFRDIESLSFVSRPHPPVLMFHGCRDRIIPVEQADELAVKSIQPIKYVRYEDAEHAGFFGYHLKQTLADVREFFASLSPAS